MAQYHLRYVDSTACYLIRMGNAVSDSHPALPRSRRKKYLILCSCRCARRRTSTDSYTLVPCSWRYVCWLCHSYHAQKCKGNKKNSPSRSGDVFFLTAASLFALTYISLRQKSDTPIEANTLLVIGVLIAAVLVLGMLASLITSWEKQTAIHWGMFLGIVLVIALPILFTFTFKQASGDNFVRGFFNWNNSNVETMDNYIVFYLKNLGVMFILPVLSLIFGTKKQRRIMMPALFLWLISEFVLFQPNPYDNNKLMLVSYFFFCVASADFVWDTAVISVNLPKREFTSCVRF